MFEKKKAEENHHKKKTKKEQPTAGDIVVGKIAYNDKIENGMQQDGDDANKKQLWCFGFLTHVLSGINISKRKKKRASLPKPVSKF